MACEKHKKEPYKGYNPCVGCELERLDSQNKKMKAALTELRNHEFFEEIPDYLAEPIKEVLGK